MLDGRGVAEIRASTVQQRTEEVYAALQHAACFHCLVEEWKECEELLPEPKDKCTFVNKKRVESKRHRGVQQQTHIVA